MKSLQIYIWEFLYKIFKLTSDNDSFIHTHLHKHMSCVNLPYFLKFAAMSSVRFMRDYSKRD